MQPQFFIVVPAFAVFSQKSLNELSIKGIKKLGELVGFMDFFVTVFLFVVPLYIANSSAMLLGGKTPLDFGARLFDKKEIFGKGKTWKGSVFGCLAGTISAFAISLVFLEQTNALVKNYVLLGFLLSLGAIVGDLAGSFVKRRFGIERGKPVFLLDQLDFIVGGLLFGALIFLPRVEQIALIIILTVIAHRLANYIAFKIKIKKVPW